MRLAVLGGAFNPPHIGHFVLADAVHTELGFDRVLFVPSFFSLHKQEEDAAPSSDRFAMISAAAGESGFAVVSDCELKRGGVSYTIDTLHMLADEYAGRLSGKPALIIGADWISGFYSWHEAEEIAVAADIILACRPGFSVPEGLSSGSWQSFVFPGMETAANVFFLENPEIAVSSSDIRRRIRTGKSWRYLVPEPVGRYIVEHNLYGHL